jgi:glycosyltransferase involved in cell wall biosynthesis
VVIAPKVGKSPKTASNIETVELGGGNTFARFIAITRLFRILVRIIRRKNKPVVFFHMITYPAIFLSPWLKLLRIRQGMWYSHQHADIGLRIALYFCDAFFSTMSSTFPLKRRNVYAIGHAISGTKEIRSFQSRDGIVVLGRITRVKRIEDLLIALAKSNNQFHKVDLWGSVQDSQYVHELTILARELRVNLSLKGGVKPIYREKMLEEYNIIYSGTLGSVDKAPLEGASRGCYVVATNLDTLSQSGMLEIYQEKIRNEVLDLSLEHQLLICHDLSPKFRLQISRKCLELNNVDSLVSSIEKVLCK